MALELMDNDEEIRFKREIRRVWEQVSLEKLRIALKFEMAMKQKAEFRIMVLTDLINRMEYEDTNRHENKPDRKSKQFPD